MGNLQDEPEWQAHEIVCEETEKAQQRLFDAIKIRVEQECPGVDVMFPKKPWAYAAYSGPKPVGFGQCSMTRSVQQMVLPICTLEWNREKKDGK